MKKEAVSRASTGAATRQVSPVRAPNIPASEVWPVTRASAVRPRKKAGSAKTANCISRLAPMPSKAEPVSRAASTVANLASPSR